MGLLTSFVGHVHWASDAYTAALEVPLAAPRCTQDRES